MKLERMATTDHERLQGLVEQAKRGDRKAYSEIVRQLMKPVVALTYRMTGDPDAAKDLAQETFVSAWQKLASFRGQAKFESWVYRIASNKTLNYLASRKRFVADGDQQIEADAIEYDSPDSRMEKEELRQGVLEFMATLPEQQRMVFNLRFYREMPFEEIASALGKATGTVKTNYREAIKKLRDFAEHKGWRS